MGPLFSTPLRTENNLKTLGKRIRVDVALVVISKDINIEVCLLNLSVFKWPGQLLGGVYQNICCHEYKMRQKPRTLARLGSRSDRSYTVFEHF